MAISFLDKSPTYVRQTDQTVQQRRSVVAAYLKSNYKVTRGTDDDVFEKVKAELAEKNIEITMSLYEADKAVLRSAYQYLVAGPVEKATVFDKASKTARNVIDAFLADGFKTWTDLNLGDAQPEEATEEAPRAPRIKLEELTGGRELLGHFAAISESLASTLEEDERLKEENARVHAENEELRERIADQEAYQEYADTELASLEDQLRATRDSVHAFVGAKLEEIAENYPEYPMLEEIARKIKSKQGQRQQRLSELVARLPQSFEWPSDKGAIIYQPTFVKVLADLAAEEQAQVLSQLEMLATQGLEYASLHTRKLRHRMPNSPVGCFQSRVADDIRFTWSKNGKVTVHWLFRKGHSRVKQIEG